MLAWILNSKWQGRREGGKKERGVRWREGGREGTRQRQTENHCNYINYKERHASMHAYKNRWRERGKKEGREEGRERVGK